MLILTRKVGEAVQIGEEVTVTILGVKGNQVRLGIHAPQHVGVFREELIARIMREREASAAPASASGNAVES